VLTTLTGAKVDLLSAVEVPKDSVLLCFVFLCVWVCLRVCGRVFKGVNMFVCCVFSLLFKGVGLSMLKLLCMSVVFFLLTSCFSSSDQLLIPWVGPNRWKWMQHAVLCVYKRSRVRFEQQLCMHVMYMYIYYKLHLKKQIKSIN
jgi:hypothetical protein